ncbi:unnamed protein product [Darwinula stevensoni]|uniref:Thymidylate synthase (FAD) n=1 Tax=Darwinula stevensoni TaxID=69355 RepID=A0A7R9A2L6_9CRUS|nr:unnamed protein product [Darwinula stevensoni]CAG0888950.1 unnamed protein product [Darwinula stevensoni]
MNVRLISKTEVSQEHLRALADESASAEFLAVLQEPEALMIYIARVSAPASQQKLEFRGLLEYCYQHGHWSVFEMIDATLEIQTSRAIAQQILRHRSFVFQEFSQRYAEARLGFEEVQARRQDLKNRQNSIDDMSQQDQDWFQEAQKEVSQRALVLYDEARRRGIAKEQARFLLPLSTRTRLYMKGSLRQWIHYVNLRAADGTQKEHQEIAIAARHVLAMEFPLLASVLGWD